MPLLPEKKDLVSHNKLKEILNKLSKAAVNVRKAENELYSKGKQLLVELNEKKTIDLKSYQQQLLNYLTKRLNVIKQIPGIISLIHQDIKNANELRERDHISIIDENYQWLVQLSQTILTSCVPITQKDRTSLFSKHENSLFHEQLSMLAKKEKIAHTQMDDKLTDSLQTHYHEFELRYAEIQNQLIENIKILTPITTEYLQNKP